MTVIRKHSLSVAFVAGLLAALVGGSASAATIVWDGLSDADGDGVDLSLNTNWAGDVVPSSVAADTAQWNGTVAGPLTLTYVTPNPTMAASGLGINLNMTSTQTGALTILPIATATDPLRLNGVTIDAGAGAFNFGDANTSNVTLGNATGQIHTWTNNSSNVATINSGVNFGNGGAGDHVLALDGTGAWNVSLVGGSLNVRAVGTGNYTINGNVTLNAAGNGPALSASSAVAGVVPVLNIASGVITLAGSTNASLWAGQTGAGAAGLKGVINQTGGDITMAGSVFIGSSVASTTNYGFYKMTGGSITQTGTNRFRIGQSTGVGSTALFYNQGGTINTTLGIALNDTVGASTGAAGTAVLYTNSGSMTSTAGTLGSTTIGLGIGGRGGQSEATIAGTATITTNGQTTLGGSVAGTPLAADLNRVAVLNLGTGSTGGTLQTTRVAQNTTAGATPIGYLNFNGGTLKAQAATTTFLAGITRATVFSGGGTIDNNGVDVTIGQSFVAPSGNGVSNIAVSGATGYKGAPYVQISGGGTPTSPATAVANLDGSGNVTSITITNPGTGYTSAPTVTLVGGGGAAGTLTPSIAAVASGGMTYTGFGKTTLSGASTYTGMTNLTGGGPVVLTGSLTGPVTLTSGTFDGTGSAGATTIANGSNVLANGNGAAGALTLSSLSFGGAATVEARVTSPTAGIIVTGALSTTPANGTVTINATSTTGSWINGPNKLISYGSYGGAIGSFTLGNLNTPLNARQAVAGLILSGSSVALNIVGDNPKWTGLVSGEWSTNIIANPKNWRLVTGNTATDYLEGDAVVFDDSATGTGTIDIPTFVSPTSVTFNNSNKSYTIGASGGGGISGGAFLTKNGTNSVTISANNSYTGPTTINAGTLTLSGTNSTTGSTTLNGGTLNVNNASALGTGALTIAAGGAKTLNNSSGAPIVSTNVVAQAWNDDFAFAGSNNLDMGAGVVTLGGAGTARTVTLNAGGVLTVGQVTSTTHGLTLAGPGVLAITTTAASNIAGELNVGAGSTLRINTGADAGTTSDFLATSLSGTGTIENGGGTERWMIVTGATDSTFNGLMQNGAGAGPLGFNKRGAGTVTINGVQTYTGATTIGGFNTNNAGILRVNGQLAGTSGTTLGTAAGPAVLQVTSTQALGAGPITFDTTGNATTARLELSNNISLNNPITLSLRTNNSVAIQNTSGNNTLSGRITLVAGGNQSRVQADVGTSLTLSGGVTSGSATPRFFTLQGDGAGLESGDIVDNIDNAAGFVHVTKEGAGVWTTTGANTYTGTTTVTAGTLLVNNTHVGGGAGAALGVDAYTVAAAGTLGGSGAITLAADKNINVTGGLSPGATAGATGTLTATLAGTGTLDLTGATALNVGAFKFDLTTPAASDKVLLTAGTLNLGAGLDFADFAFTPGAGFGVGSYKLFDAAAPITGTLGASLSGGIGAFTGTLSVDNANNDVLLTVTPGAPNNADFNDDGIVNGIDFLTWQRGFGLTGQTGKTNGNANADTVIDAADLAIWKSKFGGAPATGAAGAVPEPSACLLALLSGIALVAKRRRK